MKKKHRFLPLVLALCMVISGMTPISVEAKGKDKGTVIDVTDYGAEADSGKDNAEAIVKAVAAAKKACQHHRRCEGNPAQAQRTP